MEKNASGDYVTDKKYFIYMHITNFTFTFAIAGFYLGQLMLCYRGETVPIRDDTSQSIGGILVRLGIGIVVGAVCSIPFLFARPLVLKGNLWVTIIFFGILPILLIYPSMMYFSTKILICFLKPKKRQEIVELKSTD